VVDADLRSFDHPNLFIEGSAVFPTAGAANPTLTIAALALRSVDAIRKTLQ
jgi:choline dehydrogenase-like flavoprotein